MPGVENPWVKAPNTSKIAETRRAMKASREYSKWSDAKVARLEALHGDKPFQAYCWNREHTDAIVITAYIAMAPSGRCKSFYIGGECKAASVVCETKEEVFAQLNKLASEALERARKQHVRAFEAYTAIQAKMEVK